MKVVSRDEEKEHRKAETQLKAKHVDDAFVAKLIKGNPKLLAKNRAFFKSKEGTHKKEQEHKQTAHMDAYIFDQLEAEFSDEKEMLWSRSITNDHKARPSGGGVMNIFFDDYLWRDDSDKCSS